MRLWVTKKNTVDVTDLIPGDTIHDGTQGSGVIAEVQGTTRKGLLTWRVRIVGVEIPNIYVFKIIKA